MPGILDMGIGNGKILENIRTRIRTIRNRIRSRIEKFRRR